MDTPMPELLRSIPFPEDMTKALIAGHGTKGELLDCALAYERASADGNRELAAVHMDALAWATRASEKLFGAALAA
jgi:c-di-GMP-related signal transduction protein